MLDDNDYHYQLDDAVQVEIRNLAALIWGMEIRNLAVLRWGGRLKTTKIKRTHHTTSIKNKKTIKKIKKNKKK